MAKLPADLKAKAKEKSEALRKQLAELERLTGGQDIRERDAQRKRNERAPKKEVIIPKCADLSRRLELEADDVKWLMYYYGLGCGMLDPFWYEFTFQQREMIEDFGFAIRYRDDQADAASRGEGKTTILERLTTKYTVQGLLSYAVLCAATGTLADASLDAIKLGFEENPLLQADYPEVCYPILALENTPNRAHYQTVSGFRHDNGEPFEKVSSKFTWCGDEIILPNVPGSPSARAIIATRGLDQAIRGLKRKGRRPQLVVVDDPETEDTVRNADQAKKLEDRIEKSLGGLGSQQHPVGRVMLTTIQNRICCSYKFTDPKQKPNWKGKRYRYLIKPPTHKERWEEYIQLREGEKLALALGESTDKHCRRSHQYYLDHRAEMDEGAEVSNKNRFNPDILPDGTRVEESALQHYYNEIVRMGADAVATELDNDPPELAGPVESGLTPSRIQKQLSGYQRKEIPPGCSVIIHAMDVRKSALHWVVRAYRQDGSPFTINYGVHETIGTRYGSDEGLFHAIKTAVLRRIEEANAEEYSEKIGGEMQRRSIDIHIADAGWQTDAVYEACMEAGIGVYPIMGFGKSAGCARANFSEIQKSTDDKRPGDRWFLSRKVCSRGQFWLVCADADHWKRWEHDRWMTSPTKPGAAFLFGQNSDDPNRMNDDEKVHHAYARHLCNEGEVEEIKNGTLVRSFKAKSDNTHWLDASYYADVGASMKGIRLKTITIKPQRVAAARKPKAKRRAATYL